MQALSQLSYGPTRGAASYGQLSGMSSKQKQLCHIVRALPPGTGSPLFKFASYPVSAAGDTLKYVFLHVLLAPEQGQTRREMGTQSFRSEAPRQAQIAGSPVFAMLLHRVPSSRHVSARRFGM